MNNFLKNLSTCNGRCTGCFFSRLDYHSDFGINDETEHEFDNNCLGGCSRYLLYYIKENYSHSKLDKIYNLILSKKQEGEAFCGSEEIIKEIINILKPNKESIE